MRRNDYLLDTHVWIWSQSDPVKIGTYASNRICAPEARLFVSTISTLEIARLISIGTIELKVPLNTWIRKTLDALRCDAIEISHQIAMGAYALPGTFHKDPADRIIAATAKIFGLTVITADQRLLSYRNVKTLDARR
jgi:PIN domain nuclease of toxin-antitoxin system